MLETKIHMYIDFRFVILGFLVYLMKKDASATLQGARYSKHIPSPLSIGRGKNLFQKILIGRKFGALKVRELFIQDSRGHREQISNAIKWPATGDFHCHTHG